MAEQKKANEALNVEDALTQSEAFFIKNKKAIIGAIVAIIIIIAGVVMYSNINRGFSLTNSWNNQWNVITIYFIVF